MIIKARVSSYLYDGPHSSYNPKLHRVMSGHLHYDWRYVIKANGMTVVYRQGFCSWSAACESLEKAMKRAEAALQR